MRTRDEFLAKRRPEGPKISGKKLNKKGPSFDEDWYKKGKYPFFVNTNGNPLKGADLSVFSKVIGVKHVLAGDIRKIHTTKLANHRNATIRENESFVAGHDSGTFREWYQLDSSRITQVCVTALHEGQNTTQPLDHIPERRSIQLERIADKENAEMARVEVRKETSLNFSNPVEVETAQSFLRSGLNQNKDFIKMTRNKKSLADWTVLAAKLSCRNTIDGETMRRSIVQMAIGIKGSKNRYSFRYVQSLSNMTLDST